MNTDLEQKGTREAKGGQEIAGKFLGGDVTHGEILIRVPIKKKVLLMGRRMGQRVVIRFEPD